jgi:hypothetical protein
MVERWFPGARERQGFSCDTATAFAVVLARPEVQAGICVICVIFGYSILGILVYSLNRRLKFDARNRQTS